ncbi:MAG: 16S rRNA (cytosine(967)-C(5))-methyltransferase RsmB [Thermoanaerobaculia bacterium]
MRVRSAAARVLDRALASRSPTVVFLDQASADLDDRDRRLLRELVFGTLRWLRRLDQVIGSAASRPLDEIDPPLRSPLRLGVYQLLYLDRIPPHAAVNEAVEEARRRTHRGGAAFVNAVLRRVAEQPQLEAWPVAETDAVRHLAIESSHPDFLVARWLEQFGEARTRELVAANNRPKPLHLLAFEDRGGRRRLAGSLATEGVETEPSSLSPLGLVVRRGNPVDTDAFARGDFYLQDEASQVSALLPAPVAGEVILDAAAAPGGKSFALMAGQPTVEVRAAELSLERLGNLRANIARLGRRLPLVAADASSPPFERFFDRVVVDLPCTGTGTLRKHPELKWRVSPEELGRLSEQAHNLLGGVAPLVRPGGLLVAITCSLEPEENEEVTAEFLAANPGFAPYELESALEVPLREMITGPGSWQILPGGDHDGFTVQVLRRS